jgi:hypothetical protein
VRYPAHPHPIARARTACFAVLATACVALTITGPAAARTTPCAEQVIRDWYDNGRIDRLYPLHCYQEAIKAIPPDIRLYADAQEVIQRAMQGALRHKLVNGGPDPTPGSSKKSGLGGGGGDGSGPGSDGSTQASGTTGSSPSSVPVALLVLGGMSMALLAAGGLGYVARRRAAEGDDVDAPDEDDRQL